MTVAVAVAVAVVAAVILAVMVALAVAVAIHVGVVDAVAVTVPVAVTQNSEKSERNLGFSVVIGCQSNQMRHRGEISVDWFQAVSALATPCTDRPAPGPGGHLLLPHVDCHDLQHLALHRRRFGCCHWLLSVRTKGPCSADYPRPLLQLGNDSVRCGILFFTKHLKKDFALENAFSRQ